MRHKIAMPAGFHLHVMAALYAQAVWGFHVNSPDEIEIVFDTSPDAVVIDLKGQRHFELAGNLKSRSALEVTAKKLKILAVPGVSELVEDFGADNHRDPMHPDRAGSLNALPFSFVKLCREMANFPRSEGQSEQDAARERVALFWPISAKIVEIKANPLGRTFRDDELRDKKRAFRAVFPEFDNGASLCSPFTISGLAFDAYARGASEDEVRAFAKPWLARWSQYRTLNATREREADLGLGVEILDVNGHIVAVLHSDDSARPKYVFRTDSPDLLVNVTSDGHIVILPGHDAPLENRLRNLFRALDLAEPGRWELRTNRRSRNPMIVNGQDREPSKLGLAGLILLMNEHLTSLRGEHASGNPTHTGRSKGW